MNRSYVALSLSLVSSILTWLCLGLVFNKNNQNINQSVAVAHVDSNSIVEEKLENYPSDEIALKALKTVVRIRKIRSPMEGNSGGSGVIIHSQPYAEQNNKILYYNYILTCAHVMEDDKNCFIDRFKYYDNKYIVAVSSHPAQLVMIDFVEDIAMLEVKTTEAINEVAPLIKNLEDMRIFDPVYTIGCPMLEPPIITLGNIGSLDVRGNISSTAPAYFGNSGGGLFNKRGELLGLLSRISGRSPSSLYTNLTLSVSINKIKTLLDLNGFGYVMDLKDGSSIKDQLKVRELAKQLLDIEEKAKAQKEAVERMKELLKPGTEKKQY